MKFIGWVVLLVVAIIFINGLTSKESHTGARDFNSAETIGMAKHMSETLVKQRLKSPSTASFNNYPDITYIGDSSFKVISYVDSQNSFGAMLRTKFEATVKYIETIGEQEQWRMISFIEK